MLTIEKINRQSPFIISVGIELYDIKTKFAAWQGGLAASITRAQQRLEKVAPSLAIGVSESGARPQLRARVVETTTIFAEAEGTATHRVPARARETRERPELPPGYEYPEDSTS